MDKDMKGKYYESDYEEALIDLLEQQGWEYTNGGSVSISRNNREVLLVKDLTEYLKQRYADLQASDIDEIIKTHTRYAKKNKLINI